MQNTLEENFVPLPKSLNKWMERENVTSLDQMKNVVGLEQFYSIFPGESRYLVKDKNPKNVLQACEFADSISEIRDHQFSEVKIDRKVWDNRRRGPAPSRDYLRSTQATGNHFGDRPS